MKPASGQPAETAVLVFAKAPVPGQVKTRLASALGPERAAFIHRRLARQAVGTAVAAGVGPVTLHCAPDTRHPFFREIESEFEVTLCAQRGVDLGERMLQALRLALKRLPAALLIGSDCPALTADYLRLAARVLSEAEVDAVLGPAEDGGYVLLGARDVHAELFGAIRWGSDEVLATTRQRLRGLGMRWHELAPLRDVDRPEDLARLDRRLLE